MMRKRLQKLLHKSERGQAIILVAFAIIGLVAMVGLVTDTGILLIEYGKLKRGVDAAAVSAAQQYRLSGNVLDTEALENAAYNFLQLNQSTDITSVTVLHCESGADVFTDLNTNGTWEAGEPFIKDWNGNGIFDAVNTPSLCNPDPVGSPNDNRKLVEVIASKKVYFGFLSVIGIRETTVTASAVGEAATIDLVLVMDTSGSMAYETDGIVGQSSGDDPSACNPSNTCQPMRAVKDIALDFLDTLYFPYDRVAIVTMTSPNPSGDLRNPNLLLPLNSDKNTVRDAINNITVFQPIRCDDLDYIDGSCLKYNAGVFDRAACPPYEDYIFSSDPVIRAAANPSSCPSSNVGGALNFARSAFTIDPTDPGNLDFARLDAFWVVVTLLGGPANTTDAIGLYTNGFCPAYTFFTSPWCRDRLPSVRHAADDPLVSYENPISHVVSDISYYDADDYARDMADNLATLTSGEGVTIFTIGLGAQIRSTGTVEVGEPPVAEALLQYIAECAGEPNHNCNNPVKVINHGQYFYAPDSDALTDIFDRIAKNIATKISQ